MSKIILWQRTLLVLAILGAVTLLRGHDRVNDDCNSASDKKVNDHDESFADATSSSKKILVSATESSIDQGHQKLDYRLAFQESGGFFDDIDEREWRRLQQRHVDQFPNHSPSLLEPRPKGADAIPPNTWYQDNFEPEFACRHERRIGRKGDGGKWVCDPHRIADSASSTSGDGCLVYSIGSSGDASFEKSIKTEISDACEIHTFDINKSHVRVSTGAVVDYATELKSYATFHQYGIGTQKSVDTFPTKYKTLTQIIKDLGHEGRTIDIFKIDCEGCEWDIYEEIFQAELALKQILIEVHQAPISAAKNFFYAAHDAGYVIFHKEPNTMQANFGKLVEYAFLKLEKSFFRGVEYPSRTSIRGRSMKATSLPGRSSRRMPR